MSVIRVGSTSKYAEGWTTVFGGKATKKNAAKKPKAVKKNPKKKSRKK